MVVGRRLERDLCDERAPITVLVNPTPRGVELSSTLQLYIVGSWFDGSHMLRLSHFVGDSARPGVTQPTAAHSPADVDYFRTLLDVLGTI